MPVNKNPRHLTLLSDIGFTAMGINAKLFEKLHIPVISTARPFSFYRKVFFNNQPSRELLNSLQGKRIVDIGCGLTPFTPNSMFQICRRKGIDFYGVDPKLATGFKFGPFDKLKTLISGSRTFPQPNSPGLEKALATYADALPFENQSVDIILSSWLLFVWLQDEALLMKIFAEFDRVLKPNGKISFYPSLEWSRIEAKYPQLAKQLAAYEKSQQFLLGFNVGSAPLSFVTHLQKSPTQMR